MPKRSRIRVILANVIVYSMIGFGLTLGFAVLGALRSGQREGPTTSHTFDHGTAVWQLSRQYWFAGVRDRWRALEVLHADLPAESRSSQGDYYFKKWGAHIWILDPDGQYLRPPQGLLTNIQYRTRIPPSLLGPFDDVARLERTMRTNNAEQLLVGWPATAFGCWFPASSRLYPTPQSVIGGIELPAVVYNLPATQGYRARVVTIKRALPYLPIWRGLALDVVVFGASVWLPMSLAMLGTRHIRRHRGRCPKCGYDLVGDLASGCPECGWGRA